MVASFQFRIFDPEFELLGMFVKVSVVCRHRPRDFVDFDDDFGSFLDEGGYSLAKQGDKKLSE